MSSITGSRRNCEQGQPRPQLSGGAPPTTTTKPQGGPGKGTTTCHKPHPTGGGGGGYHGVGGGGGGAWQPSVHTDQIMGFIRAYHTWVNRGLEVWGWDSCVVSTEASGSYRRPSHNLQKDPDQSFSLARAKTFASLRAAAQPSQNPPNPKPQVPNTRT